MKKILFAAMALGMCMTSCMNDEFPNAVQYGYINLNVSNDPTLQTRAVQNVEDLSKWVIEAVNGSAKYTLTTGTTKVKQGTYVVSAKSHETEEKALLDNSGWGAAYYEGSVSGIEVNPGITAPAEVKCNTAKNARLKVQFSLVGNFTDYSLTATERNLTFDSSNYTTALAYYGAEDVVEYSLTYKYNGKEVEKPITGTITMKGAATENIISIASNDNGNLTVSVSYDNAFGEGNKHDFTFDAATGENVSKQ
jgi:hypothetical protein